MEKFRLLIIKSLTTRVAPMVYVMMFVSVFIGFCFFTGLLVGHGESLLFAGGALISSRWWGLMLMITAAVCEIGFRYRMWNLVSYGGLGGFMLWLMATIDLGFSGHIYGMLILGLFHLIFHGYVYLSASLGVLERATYRD